MVDIASIGKIWGNNDAPANNESKAFMSSYLEGLYKKISKVKLTITGTDILPGFVDTPMA